MGFPDDFIFTGSKIEIAKQIGNAVPPHLAGAIASTMADMLNKGTIKRSQSKPKRQVRFEEVGQVSLV